MWLAPSVAEASSERAFEMVSPQDKGGYPVLFTESSVKLATTQLSRDGEVALYSSFAAFADARSGMPQTYRAVRTEQGWVSRVASPPTMAETPEVFSNYSNFWLHATPDLRFGLVKTRDALDAGGEVRTFDLYQSTEVGRADLVSVGNAGERIPDGRTLSADGSEAISDVGDRVYFSTDAHMVAADIDRVLGSDVYERSGGRTTLLNQDSSGVLLNRCGSVLGGWNWILPVRARRNAVASDGRRVIFSVPSGILDFSDLDCIEPTRVFMKTDSEGLLEISASESVVADAPQWAVFQGAASDGSKVFFTSAERLVDGASSGGLYVYDVLARRGSRLRLAVAAGDIAVVRVSDDGSAVYFTSAEQPVPGGRSGMNALYVYRDIDGIATVRWIADDEAGDFSQTIAWQQEHERPAEVSRNGVVLAFQTKGKLTGFDNTRQDTGQGTTQVFIYDDRTGLRCASCNGAGQRPSDAPVIGDASLGQLGPSRVVTDDGSAVFFTSPDRLVADDVNSARDVYEFSAGRVRLISSGRGRHDALLADASASGDTVYFATADGLVPQDTDGGDLDMYVARRGGGFLPPTRRDLPGADCNDDGCQGPDSPRRDDIVPGSTGLEAEQPVDEAMRARTSARILRVGKQQLKNLARGRTAFLNVRINGAGTVRVTLEARISGRRRVVARGSARTGNGGSVSRVPVRLSKVARRTLGQHRSLKLWISARVPNQTGTEAVTVMVHAVLRSRGGRR